MDDPLSAVDAHVSENLMNNCICGILANTTRILVTHQTHFLDRADVVVMLHDSALHSDLAVETCV